MGYFFIEDAERNSKRRERERERLLVEQHEEEQDEYQEEEREWNWQEELLERVKFLDRQRGLMNLAIHNLNSLLNTQPDMKRIWQEFTQAGGVTAEELHYFTHNGRKLKTRPLRRKRHMRMVVNNDRPTVRRVRLYGQPDDAA
jgi:hypothetical protein